MGWGGGPSDDLHNAALASPPTHPHPPTHPPTPPTPPAPPPSPHWQLRWIDTPANGLINKVWFSTWFGGSSPQYDPGRPCTSWFRNFKLEALLEPVGTGVGGWAGGGWVGGRVGVRELGTNSKYASSAPPHATQRGRSLPTSPPLPLPPPPPFPPPPPPLYLRCRTLLQTPPPLPRRSARQGCGVAPGWSQDARQSQRGDAAKQVGQAGSQAGGTGWQPAGLAV